MKTRPIVLALAAFALAGALAVAAVPAGADPASASITTSPIAWHMVSVPSGTLNIGVQTTLARDAAGNLHAIFESNESGKFQYFAAKFGPLGLASGTPSKVFGAPWELLSPTPSLLSGSGATPMLLVFDGQRGTSDNYNNGCVYGTSSPTGATWTLSTDGFSHACVGISDDSATRVGSTVETAWDGPGDAFTYHVGSSPLLVSSADQVAHVGVSGADALFTTTASDATGGAHLAIAGFLGLTSPDSKNGYFAWDTSIPTVNHVRKAPGSGNVQPFQRVAMVSGGPAHKPFVAYCTGVTTCTGVRLWNIDTNATSALANSAGSKLVAASAGPAGRIWVAFYRESPNTVTVARTNEAGTKFGPERVYKAPPFLLSSGLQIQGSAGRLDLLFEGYTSKNVLFHAQVLPPLTLLAGKTSFKGTAGATITFSVFDAGMPVPGSKVSLLGHAGTTGPRGSVKLKIGKTAKGTYTASAKKAGYIEGTLKVHAT